MDAVAASDDHILGGCRGSLAKVEGCVNWGVGGMSLSSENVRVIVQ